MTPPTHAGGKALAAIIHATSRMRVMIDHLLAHSRASQEPLCRQPVDLGMLVDDLAAETLPYHHAMFA